MLRCLYQIAVAFLLLPCLVASAALAERQGEKKGGMVVVAISSSRSSEAGLVPLRFANDDAARFLEAMALANSDEKVARYLLKEASFADLERSLHDILATEDPEKLVLYYSGHATPNGLHLRDRVLARDRFLNLVQRFPGKTKVVVLDACFAGSLTAKGIKPAEEFAVPTLTLEEPEGTVFLAATSDRAYAFESEQLQGSIFTHYLVEGLYGEADGDDDSFVTVDELYQYVFQKSRLATISPSGATQDPSFSSRLHGQGAVVVAQPRAKAGQIQLGPEVEGRVVIASTNGLGLMQIEKAAGKIQEVRLPASTYLLRFFRGREVAETRVSVEREKVTVASLEGLRWRRVAPVVSTAKGASPWIGIGEFGLAAVAPERKSVGPIIGFFLQRRLSSGRGFGYLIGGEGFYLDLGLPESQKKRAGGAGYLGLWARIERNLEMTAALGQQVIDAEPRSVWTPVGRLSLGTIFDGTPALGLDVAAQISSVPLDTGRSRIAVLPSLLIGFRF
jgi:hypothetical protein